MRVGPVQTREMSPSVGTLVNKLIYDRRAGDEQDVDGQGVAKHGAPGRQEDCSTSLPGKKKLTSL